jgi:hypothetical protein
MEVAICICSKYPNPFLYKCIENIYKNQINIDNTQRYRYEIHVIDSDSDNLINYIKISEDFPHVKVHMIKNKNYDYGAWKYMLDTYNSFDIYFCIQDTVFINNYIDLNKIDDNNVYAFHYHTGYNSHLSVKDLGIEYLKESNLDYIPLIDTNFNVAIHCSFILNHKTLENIFKHLIIPPIDKNGACTYERLFGLYFIIKNIHVIDLYNFMYKIHGGRY